MADASVFLMNMNDERFVPLLCTYETATGRFEPPLGTIGVGEDVTIAELAATVAKVVAFLGGIVYNTSKLGGTSRKLLDVDLLASAAWRASTTLSLGLSVAYAEFAASQAGGR